MKTSENELIPVRGSTRLIPGLGFIVLFAVLLAVFFLLTPQETSNQGLRKRALETLQIRIESPHPFVRSAAAKAAGGREDD